MIWGCSLLNIFWGGSLFFECVCNFVFIVIYEYVLMGDSVYGVSLGLDVVFMIL